VSGPGQAQPQEPQEPQIQQAVSWLMTCDTDWRQGDPLSQGAALRHAERRIVSKAEFTKHAAKDGTASLPIAACARCIAIQARDGIELASVHHQFLIQSNSK